MAGGPDEIRIQFEKAVSKVSSALIPELGRRTTNGNVKVDTMERVSIDLPPLINSLPPVLFFLTKFL